MIVKSKIGMGESLSLVSAVSYALSNVVQAWTMAEAPLYVGVALKSLPIWIIATIIYIKGKHGENTEFKREKISLNAFLLLILLGIFFHVLGNATLISALKYGGVIISTPIMGTQAIWISILAYFFLREIINIPMIIGMVISVLGTVVLTLGKSSSNIYIENLNLSIILSLITAVSFAIGGLIQRYLLTREKLSEWTVMFYSLTSAQLILFVLVILNGNMNFYFTVGLLTFLKLMLTGMFCAVAIITLTKAMVFTQAAIVTTIGSLQTAIAPVLAAIFLKEEINGLMIFGILLIMAGVYIVQRKRAV
jgi:drug/metabolite transporter (DMT)-like permease